MIQECENICILELKNTVFHVNVGYWFKELQLGKRINRYDFCHLEITSIENLEYFDLYPKSITIGKRKTNKKKEKRKKKERKREKI